MSEKIMGVPNPGSPGTQSKVLGFVPVVTGGAGFFAGLGTSGAIMAPINILSSKLKLDKIAASLGIAQSTIITGIQGFFLMFLGGIGTWIYNMGRLGKPVGAAIIGYVVGAGLMWMLKIAGVA